MRVFLFTVLLCASAFGAGPGQLSVDEIVLRSCQRESGNVQLRKQYTYRLTSDVRRLDSDGGTKDREIKSWDVMYVGGRQYRRLVGRDGKPLPANDAREEERKLDREVGKRKGESEEDRRKFAEKEAKEAEDDRRLRLEVAKAFTFTLLGEEPVNGRPCWRVGAEPKGSYKPATGDSKFLPKVHGTLWIDQETFQWAKIDAESLDTISAGLGMFRVGKGFRLTLEQAWINREMWAPVAAKIRANARAFLLIGARFDVAVTFADYRKYSVSSTITTDGASLP